MLGQQTYQPQLFTTFNIEEFIPKNHLLRKLDNLLDLSFIRELTEPLYCPDNGRPSIDPELFIRMILVQYFYKIASDRQLCEEIGFNLAYRWFCRLTLEDKVPHHSSLTRIRDRFGEPIFKSMFERVVRECIEKGLVKSGHVMVDGSIFRADASLDSLEHIDTDNNDDDDNSSNTRRFNCGINKVKGKKISNQTHVSKTDPDCSIAGKEGQPKNLYYKAHITSESESRVILDIHVSKGSDHETKYFQDRINEVEENFNLSINEITADAGYGSADNIQYAKRKNVNHFIPLLHSRVGRQEQGFSYDRAKDCYICPNGNVLERKNNICDQKKYSISWLVCARCPINATCLKEHNFSTHRGKVVLRNIHQDLFEEVMRSSQTSQFKQKLRERMWKLEGLIGEAKNRHLLNRAKYRGRLKVQIQAYITATVQNLKRLLGQDGTIFGRENIIFHLKLFFGLKNENYSFSYKNAEILL